MRDKSIMEILAGAGCDSIMNSSFAYPRLEPIPFLIPGNVHVRDISPFICDFCDRPQSPKRVTCEFCGTSYEDSENNVNGKDNFTVFKY